MVFNFDVRAIWRSGLSARSPWRRYDIFLSNTTPYYLTKGKQKTKLAECHIPYTVPSANIFTVQRVYGRRQITFSADSARKAPDGWSAQRDRYSSRSYAPFRLVVASCYDSCDLFLAQISTTESKIPRRSIDSSFGLVTRLTREE